MELKNSSQNSKYRKKYSIDVQYGADQTITLFKSTSSPFNLRNIPKFSQLGKLKPVLGVTEAYVYFGLPRSTFSWHIEDYALYSISYLHAGSPKRWYVLPPSKGHAFETSIGSFFDQYKTPTSSEPNCPAFMNHKMFVGHPKTFVQRSNLGFYSTTLQEKGDLIITFPYAYHSGYNTGKNIAEAANFTGPGWLKVASKEEHYLRCTCVDSNPVLLDLSIFDSSDINI